MADAVRIGRDLRLDFFRGLSLFFIFIDHIPENVLAYFTLRSIAFNDAAEVFIFISGYTAALVYGQSLRQRGALVATAQIYRRVWQLYVAHVFLFVIFIAEVSYTLVAAETPMYADELGVGDFLAEPHIAIMRALLLSFQPAFMDILPLYILLLGTFPLVLFALELDPVLPAVLSAVLYVLTQSRGWALHTLPDGHVWFFNPLAWQFLFILGASFGHARVSGRRPLRVPPWLIRIAIGIAAIFAVISISWDLHHAYDPFPPLFVRALWNHTLDKTNLAPLRLLSFCALAATTVHFVKPGSAFLTWPALRPVILCGQHSLYVFCLGILLSVLGHFILAEFDQGIAVQMAINVGGIGLMTATAYLLEWYKRTNRLPPRGSDAVQPAFSE